LVVIIASLSGVNAIRFKQADAASWQAKVHDWLNIDEKIGQVVAITWRSVHLRTHQQQLIIVPNSVLAQGSLFNYSRPTKIHGEEITVGFSYDDPPNKVMGILAEIAQTTEGIVTMPPPVMEIMSYDDFAIVYQLRFFVMDYAQMPQLRSAVTGRCRSRPTRNIQIIDPATRSSSTHQQIIDGRRQSLPRMRNCMRMVTTKRPWCKAN
jgi:hypothetical protein